MPAFRTLARSFVVFLLGTEAKPRKIIRGPASGLQICVSPAENLGYLLGTYEPHLQTIIKAYVSTGDTVFDIGASVGYISLSLAKRVGPSGRVAAFEPFPENIASLRENIAVNRLENVLIIDCAVSDFSGEAVLRMVGNRATASLAWHRNDPGATELPVKTVSIDELVDAGELGYPKFVKVDVEGAEGQVLRGMRRTLAAAQPVVFVECSDAGRDTTWHLLRELGYQCQSAITRKWVDHFDEYSHADYLWLPAGRQPTS